MQSLFPWFCLCFQRAFKSFDDVWRLWEVSLPWTEGLGPHPSSGQGEALFLVSRLGMELSRLGFLGGSEEVSARARPSVILSHQDLLQGSKGRRRAPQPLRVEARPAVLPPCPGRPPSAPHPLTPGEGGAPQGQDKVQFFDPMPSVHEPPWEETHYPLLLCPAQHSAQHSAPHKSTPTHLTPPSWPAGFHAQVHGHPQTFGDTPGMVGLSTVALPRLLSNALDSHRVILPPSPLSPSSLPLPFSFPPSLSPPLLLFLPSS